MTPGRVSFWVLALALAFGRAVAADPQSRIAAGEPRAADARLLDVPYVAQSEALCGGAAAAMVLRYWGAAGVYAEDFAPLATRAALQIDVGAGLRVRLPGTQGALRLDAARGLRDGRTALSIAWQTAWPGW